MELFKHAIFKNAARALRAFRGEELLNVDEFVDRFFVRPTAWDRWRLYDAFFKSRCGLYLHAQASEEAFFVDSSDNFMSREVYHSGASQFSTLDAGFRLIESERRVDLKDWTLIDIGANIGVICIPAVARGMCAKAIAIEPTPKTTRLLRANIALNGLEERIVVYETALSDREGRAEFELSEDNTGDNRLSIDAAENAYGEGARRKISVTVKKFDDLFAGLNMHNCVVWLDVQGFEGFVLAGASKIALAKTPLVMEFWPYGIRRTQSLPLLLAALQSYDRFCVLSRFDEEEPGTFRPISNLPKLWDAVATREETFVLDLLLL